jgi:hypothetical protein
MNDINSCETISEREDKQKCLDSGRISFRFNDNHNTKESVKQFE